MRTTPALRILTAALLTAGTFAATAAGTAAAAPPAHSEGRGGDGPVRGTVVSRTPLDVRAAPTTRAPAVDRLAPGSRVKVMCKVHGQYVNGDRDWYWLAGTRAWASAAFVETGRHRVPVCAAPPPECSETSSDGWVWSPAG
ncbi:SH3 domain-containing protein [Streptomyces sp. NPDC001595]|uniref:SH3 domain-containing protein n=1 Tax=Streptomyces sp. NPDC001532 TaxID=3154520 RepID=UPI0033302E1B